MFDDDLVRIQSKKLPNQGDVPDVFRLPQVAEHDFFDISVDELQHLFSSASLTSLQYTRFCLERIRRVNPYLECVLETNPDAEDIARALDDERRRGKVRGPLHGVPVLVKDNMATADNMQTTAGSWALLGSTVPRDAHIVHLLRTAGAVIIGHSNMDEWAGGRSSLYSFGYSPRGGQARNAFDLSRGAKGSSTGSAIAVTSNVVPLSFGSETDTSIIWPAMVSGIVGIKPNVGLTSRAGVIPLSVTQDTIGPHGRSVADAARGLDAIADVDQRDEATLLPERHQESNYSDFLTDRTALRGAKFGLPMKRFFESAPKSQRDVVLDVIDLITWAGAQVLYVEMPCAEERIGEDGDWDAERGEPAKSEFTVIITETYNTINAYLASLQNTTIKTLQDVMDFNEANTGTEGAEPGDHPAFITGQDYFHKAVKTQGRTDDTYKAALRHIRHQCREQGIDAALQYKDNNGDVTELDALLFCDIKGAGQQIAAQAGYPVITIPVGVDDTGMPVGLSLQHTAWREGALVKWASAIEDLVREQWGPRKTPLYRNHLAKNTPVL